MWLGRNCIVFVVFALGRGLINFIWVFMSLGCEMD